MALPVASPMGLAPRPSVAMQLKPLPPQQQPPRIIPKVPRPNFLLMVADDMDVSDVGMLRSDKGTAHPGAQSYTPNLDAIGRKGVALPNAHAASPLCAPSRFSILTGLRPQCAQTTTALRSAAATATDGNAAAIPPIVDGDTAPRASRHPTLATRLSSLGYYTGLVGLWHLGTPTPVTRKRERARVEDTPPDKFAVAGGGKIRQTVKSEYAALQEHVKRIGGFDEAERLYAGPLDRENSDVVLPRKMKVHNVEWVADGAAKFIQVRGANATRQPFFLFVGWSLPHGPDAERSMREGHLQHTPQGMWGLSTAQSDTHKATRAEVRKRAALTSSTDPDAAAGSRQGRSDYRLALSWLDRGIGTVMWALNRRGAVHNTLTVFTSDHGSTDKGHCYSRSLQVPLLMQWPDLISPMGAVAVPPASLLDVAATFLHAATDATNASLFAPTPARAARVIAGVIIPRMPPLPSLEGLTPPPLHGTSMLPALPTVRPIYRRAPLVPGGAHAGATGVASSVSKALPDYQVDRKLICEAGHSRSLSTSRWRYVYSPQYAVESRKPKGDDGLGYVAARHPAVRSVEQLYDLREDPGEQRELIEAYSLLVSKNGKPQPPLGVKGSEAAEALHSFRKAMQSDLLDIAKGCGV